MTADEQHIPGCTGKKRYGSVREAGAAIRRIQHGPQKDRGERRAYPCRGCGGWHLTSASARKGEPLPAKPPKAKGRRRQW